MRVLRRGAQAPGGRPLAKGHRHQATGIRLEDDGRWQEATGYGKLGNWKPEVGSRHRSLVFLPSQTLTYGCFGIEAKDWIGCRLPFWPGRWGGSWRR